MAKDRGTGELVTVFEAGDPGVLAVAKSLLQDAGIPFFAKGEGEQDLFGLGRMGTGYSPIVGAVQVQVAPVDAARARQLLADLQPK